MPTPETPQPAFALTRNTAGELFLIANASQGLPGRVDGYVVDLSTGHLRRRAAVDPAELSALQASERFAL